MSDIHSIDTSIDPQTLDFDYLRKKGIQRIEKLAGKVWTDYNTHDPGITILEYLCFGLQDLNYRTALPIEDITHDPHEKLPVPKDSIYCNPITFNDFRKLILDVEGVRNAWIEQCPRPDFLSQPVKGQYQVLLEIENDSDGTEPNTSWIIKQLAENRSIEILLPSWDEEELVIDWLDSASIVDHVKKVIINNGDQVILEERWKDVANTYKERVYQENDEHRVFLDYGQKVLRCVRIKESVKEVLNAHRNLCEDFVSIKAVNIEEIGFTADIEIESEAHMMNVLKDILFKIDQFISPQVHFQTANALSKKHVSIDKIFEAGLLNHGILLSEELLTRHEAIYVSDIVQLIMNCVGVKSIKRFEMANYLDGILDKGGNKWCLPLSIDTHYVPRLAPRKCYINFYKDGFPFEVNVLEVIKAYKEVVVKHEKWSKVQQEDVKEIPYPVSKQRSLIQYQTLQHDFPQNYGIGHEGLPSGASSLRRAQAGQLKGYLTVFEQLIANSLAQLHHAKHLLSMSKSGHDANPEEKRSYFYQLLDNIPSLKSIYNPKRIQEQLTEPVSVYEKRTNEFLNHLLARCGMNVEDYIMLTTDISADVSGKSRLDNKYKLLKDILHLNTDRSRAYNYMQVKEVWETDNVSGFKKRLCALLKITDSTRRALHNLDGGVQNEGFHLIEHILLLPKTQKEGNPKPSSLYIEEINPCIETPTSQDPYSFRMTLIIPGWIGRFTNSSFRKYFERMAHLESPAHIRLHFFWLTVEEMKAFEEVYKPWIDGLGQSPLGSTRVKKERNALIEQLNKLYHPEQISAIDPIIKDTSSYDSLVDHPDWEIPSFDQIKNPKWYVHQANTIIQNEYIGCNNPESLGLGTVALYHRTLLETIESIELTLTVDRNEYSEAGLVFLWRSKKDFWVFTYRNLTHRVQVIHVKDDKVQLVIENPVRDLSDKVIAMKLSKINGLIRLEQSSSETFGSEFHLNISHNELVHTRSGLFTRYSNHTKFHRMELVEDKVHNIIPVRELEDIDPRSLPSKRTR